mmetsp:Transcript_20982/g.44909  ORF Transcript_20982/g.44909 Transcript_20982/m.44909 type:complete len:257 (-) Transcript_20982:173-943(-)
MADNLRQRRGKKSSGGDATPSATTAGGESANGGNEKEELTPIEQLKSARARLVVSRDRTADLHAAWKSQLFLLSLLVVVVTMHALQSSVSSCIREIKESDEEGGSAGVSGAEATKIILADSYCEVLGVVISSLLAYFLALKKQTPSMELDGWPYMISSAMVPMILGLYFHSNKAGCLAEGGDMESSDDPAKDYQRHQFPAVVIYHTIVTVAFWFMKSGKEQCEEHVELVDQSIRDFARMDEKMELRKKLKRRVGRK